MHQLTDQVAGQGSRQTALAIADWQKRRDSRDACVGQGEEVVENFSRLEALATNRQCMVGFSDRFKFINKMWSELLPEPG